MTQYVLITGMHRSGTSLTANLLQEAGVYLGDDLLEASQHNPRGYYESKKIVQFHDELLGRNGTDLYMTDWPGSLDVTSQDRRRARSLAQDFETAPLAGWKDPRMVLFLDLWSEVLPQAKFVFCYRPAAQVIDSLLRRKDSTLLKRDTITGRLRAARKSLRLWIEYNQRVLAFRNEHPDRSLLLNVSNYDETLGTVRDEIGNFLENVDVNTELGRVYEPGLLEDSPSLTSQLVALFSPRRYLLSRRLEERASN